MPTRAMSTTFLVALLALSALLLVATAAPCDGADDTCLSPLQHNRVGSSSFQRGGRGGRGSRRPGRPGGSDDDEEEEEEDEEQNEEQDDDDDDDDDDFCFPGSAQVHVQGAAAPVAMRDLRVGDRVLVAPCVFSHVFFFGHRAPSGRFRFVRLRTARAAVTLSAGHYVYANGQLTAAGDVREGDVLEAADGAAAPVTAVETVREEGLYNPHTLHGDIVVDGVRASSYTRSVDAGRAQALLAPLRAAFRMLGVDVAKGWMDHGAPAAGVARALRRGGVATT